MENSYSYEKLGLFYLGRELAINGDSHTSMPLLLKSKDLTTHAAIIGMTGSGKTGLGIGLIEEAIMDNIPSIIVDPKGDMSNLLLTFPKLRGQDIAPWVDPMEAAKNALSPAEYADAQAKLWENGLLSWQQPKERIALLRNKTNFTIYTPGSSAGVPVSVLESFAPPAADVLADTDTLNGLVDSVVTGLLSLVKINVESTNSREYVLLSSLFLHHWRKSEGLNMEALIGHIVNPPFKKVGVLALDVFYPQSERMELALKLNGVIASPTFASWTQGQSLDIQKILYDDQGKSNTAIFSIAHLGESERMFFVTMLLNRLIDWMRRQQGLSSLKALLYMDEIFGYFPPTANPPSKKPMLLLLKQARAYGVGIVLATQNPVDLDYKGLSNIGTWFIGRLQTSQDQDRVIDGIAGSSESGVDKKIFRKMLSEMQGRQFLLRSAHLDDVLLFETRWVMSYLKGPISLLDIEKLMAHHKSEQDVSIDEQFTSGGDPAAGSETLDHPPLITETIKQRFYLHPVPSESYLFEPWLAAYGAVRFYNAKRNIDVVTDVALRIYLDERFSEPEWEVSEENPYRDGDLQNNAPSAARYYPLAAPFASMKDLRNYTRSFADYLYNNKKLELFRVAELNLESVPDESLAEFRVRLSDRLRELKDQEISKLKEKYATIRQRLEDKIARTEAQLEKEKADVKAKTTDTILSFGTAVLGAFFGRKALSASSMSRASTGIKNAGRLAREKRQAERAQEDLMRLEDEIEQLAMEIDGQTSQIAEKYEPGNFEIETFAIKPRKSDIFNLDLFILWEMVP